MGIIGVIDRLICRAPCTGEGTSVLDLFGMRDKVVTLDHLVETTVFLLLGTERGGGCIVGQHGGDHSGGHGELHLDICFWFFGTTRFEKSLVGGLFLLFAFAGFAFCEMIEIFTQI